MGQQQLLLVILGVIVVGISIAVGMLMFEAYSIQSNKDAMISDLENITANARAYFVKPGRMGGGDNSYTNYAIPLKLANTENGHYTCTSSAIRVFFTAVSANNPANRMQVTLQRYNHGEGLLISWTYTGDFQ